MVASRQRSVVGGYAYPWRTIEIASSATAFSLSAASVMVLAAYCHDIMIVVLLTHVACPFVLCLVLADCAAAWATEF